MQYLKDLADVCPVGVKLPYLVRINIQYNSNAIGVKPPFHDLGNIGLKP